MTVTTVVESDDATIVTVPAAAATAWTAYVPTLTWQIAGGTPSTFVITSARYTQIGKTVHFYCAVTMSNVGAGNNGVLFVSLPLPCTGSLFGAGHEVGLIGKMLSVTASGNNIYIVNYDATTVVTTGNGAIFVFGGTYETT